MERKPGDLDLGLVIVHTGVLRARLRRSVRRLRRLLVLGATAAAVVATALYPGWRGAGWLRLAADDPDLIARLPGGVVHAGEAARVVAGTHPVVVEQAGRYPWEGVIQVTEGMTVTLTPPGSLPRARHMRRVALPGRGMAWETVVAGPGWWRLFSAAADGGRAAAHVTAARTTRLQALDLAPVADVMDTPTGNVWIEWTRARADSDSGLLRAALPGRTTLTRAMERVTGAFWRPDGAVALLVQTRGSAPGVVVWDVQRSPEPGPVIATLGGELVGVHWRSDGQAAILISRLTANATVRCEAALLQWDAPMPAPPDRTRDRPQVTVLSPPERCALGLAPFAWGAHGVWWTALTADGRRLEYWPFDGSGPWDMGGLPAAPVALRVEADGTPWLVMRSAAGAARLTPWPDRQESIRLDDAPVLGEEAVGVWNAAGWLLSDGRGAVWVIDLPAAGDE